MILSQRQFLIGAHCEGGYVVINTRTNDVVQISNLFKADWKAPWQ